MAIDLASASAELRLDVSNFVTNAQRASDAAQNIRSATDSATSGGFLGWVTDNEAALNRWGKGLLTVGGIITGAFAAPIIAGSKAAWGQVDAVEQATVAMRAYVEDAEKVDQVLADLVAYARSDLGVLFQRQDLFEAAQSMLIYGASVDEVTGYVEIMSRSVGLGTGNWQDLNRIIGRIGSTGKITRDDMDMLTKAGYQLDGVVAGQTITWEELFAILDKGIPADALAGQADTIRGKTIRLQSALRGLGLAFLGVDSETSKFIEGGLGWQMMRGMERLTDLMKRASPAVQGFGNVIAAIARPIGTLFDLLLRLPQPVQTAMLMFTAASGVLMTFSGGLLLMLPRIASTITAFQALGGLSGVLGGVATAIRAIGTASLALFANPVILSGALALGALFAAYKTNFMGFGDAVDTALGKLGSFTDALDVLLGKPSTKNFDIVTTADNVWDEWQLQEDGSYKNVKLGITSRPDDGSLQYMGYDEDTGKWVVLHITADGEEVPGWVESSSQDPNDPTKFFMEISLEGGEKVTAVYDEVTGTYQILEDPAEFIIDADKAISDMKALEKAALAVRSIFILVNARIRDFNEILGVLAQKFAPVIQFAQDAYSYFDPFRGVIERVTGTFRTLSNILTGDWGSISWEDIMDAVGLGLVYTAVSALAGAYRDLKSAWGSWTGRERNYADTVETDMGPQPTMNPDAGGSSAPAPAVNIDPTIPLWSGLGLGRELAKSTNAADLFNAALNRLNPEIVRSDVNINKTASTLPMYTGATQDAESATGAMATGMGASFGAMAASALSNFTSMQSTASDKTSAMQRLASDNVTSMGSTVSMRMDAMALLTGLKTRAMARDTETQTGNMSSSASTNAASMASTVGMRLSAMQLSSALKFRGMATDAETSGKQMSTGMTGWMLGAHAAMALRLGMMVSLVRDTGGRGYDAGYYAGSMISRGFANGMLSQLGVIRGAANAMVNAAQAAVIAKALISSPSRLFMQYGEWIGEGLEIGMRNMIPAIGRTADLMVDTGIPSPAFSTPIGAGHGGTTVIDNSKVEYIALNDHQFLELLQAKDKANIVHDAMTDRNAARQYGRGR